MGRYGLLIPAPALAASQVTFLVDMSAQTALGNFDPSSDAVYAADVNGWNTTANPLTKSPGNTIQYPFVLNGTTWRTSVGNRNYTIASTNAQTLPLVAFNNVNDLGPVDILPLPTGQLGLSWTAGPFVRLRTATVMESSSWSDVPNTQGSNSVTSPWGNTPAFFRLVGP